MKLMSGIGAALIALSLTAISVAPSVAQSNGPGQNFSQGSGPDWRQDNQRGWDNQRGNDRNRGHFERRGNYAYFNKHRGYKNRHAGYSYYNGFWFPPAAFIVGTIIGGALNSGTGHYNTAHVQWCEANYRTYRASDNTFQPYNGPRQFCVSPYRG